jgi:hypothetical protein
MESSISINYSSYCIEDLLDAKEKIDRDKYPENYQSLQAELSARDAELAAYHLKMSNQAHPNEKIVAKSCSLIRIFSISLIGFLVSLPFSLTSNIGDMSTSDKFWSFVIVLMAGLPLLHSFLKGWTLSRHGVATLANDVLSYTIMQSFYSFVVFYIITSTTLRW